MDLYKTLSECRLCPRECGVDRLSGETGFCGAGVRARIARADLHFWEEPCISGENGSGAVFFSNCTLRCVYCQNYDVSSKGKGLEKADEELAECFLELQDKGANNINLVTPTHYIPQIVSALDNAKKHGLNLPVVYNCGGYEKAETLKLLDGYVDVYLPDVKYYSDKYAKRYSGAKDYFKTASEAVSEMYRQVGKWEFDNSGLIKKGVIVRHLLLPGLLFEAKKIVDYLYEKYEDKIWLSMMNQYTIMPGVRGIDELNRNLPKGYYDTLVDYCASLGMENVYVQEEGSSDLCYIPEFYGNYSLYQKKGSKMKRGSGDTAERYKQDIFKYAKQKYGAEPDYPWVKSPESAVLRHKDNAKWFALLMTVAKTSLGLNDPEIVSIINVKCDPVLIGSLIRENGYFPAYHMNKEHWITVLLDGSVSIDELYNLIDLSYDLSK